MKEFVSVGLDIGTSVIRVVVGKSSEEEKSPSIIGIGEAPAAGLRKGVIVDVEEAVSSISQALEKAERMTGIPVDHAVVSVGGAHIVSLESHGVIAVSRADGEITEADIVRVVDASQAISIPPNREILHVIPKTFTVDGQAGIKDPLGMSGIRLEVDSQIIQASVPFIKNLTKCIIRVGLEVDDLVLAPLAASQAVLTKRQKELGCVLINIGGGTTGIAIFEEGELMHTNVLPIGASHITNDLAIGLRITIDTAELVKLEYGTAQKTGIKKDEEINLASLDSFEEGTVQRLQVAEIIQARLEEIFDMVNKELKALGRDGQLPAGAVLTGGGAKLPGIMELAKKELRLPIQIGGPKNISTVIDRVDEPGFCTAVGLVLWGNEYVKPSSGTLALKKITSRVIPAGLQEKVGGWFKSILP
ncbi:MAG: cell division protein FtsA [Candidatus Doudnabacteria bacterium CG10_big_fil_rev_8_21_14_0_10_41_10]|uniref:Cell division protein FtsA n=1 Tax=Candidatus Doudnabacteria bacterium CG10_big_fil_rev_8_21_14_0_10_41_10 TaxID=1974551 RepID=A0A2H0VCI3_9BACT|nr:MAG: cell division protein FtsA [Candidatus Doudnabacteria bacterium CG10_big_fil_rev_8_21_14_0_10_41_10]